LQLSAWEDWDHLFEGGIAGVVPDLIGLSAAQESDPVEYLMDQLCLPVPFVYLS